MMTSQVTGVPVNTRVDVLASGVFTVLNSCEGKEGMWYCVTHDRVCTSQLDKDMHISDNGAHVLGWLCKLHGLETP